MPQIPVNVNFSAASYVLSAHLADQLPPDEGVEVAFAGRSNVGKSSAINAITNQGRLAKTSKTPGRTQQINFFALGGQIHLVDLPGYGFARAPEELRSHWGRFITDYILGREALRGLVLPMDIRHPLTPLDTAMLELCAQAGLPVHILLTKADKLSRGKGGGVLQKMRHALAGEGMITLQLFSALKKTGVEEARTRISDMLQAEAPAGDGVE